MKPPGVKFNWDDLDVIAQADLIAYNQIRENEEAEALGGLFKGL